MRNKLPLQKKLLLWTVPTAVIFGLLVLSTYLIPLKKTSTFWPTQGWRSTTPEEVGIDSTGIASMVDQFQGKNIHSFVLIRDGSIFAEGYNADHGMTAKQDVLSVTKSITSALVGIALEDKLINKLEQPIADFFPTLSQDVDSRKKDIKLSDILTMTSGFSWNNVMDASSIEMTKSADWIQYVLGLPLADKPGTSFTYNNGAVHLLSAILEKATGKSEAEYAKEALFNPIGIEDYTWDADPKGHSIGSFGLNITARDMAKLGYLYLNNGEWDGKQIIPKQWIQASTKQYLRFTDSTSNQTEIGYGYLWWLREGDYKIKKTGIANMYSADGSGGQRIFVMPEQNMVVVFTANNQDPFFADSIVDKFIVPSIKSNKPLPPNPEGVVQLNNNIQAFNKLKGVK